MSRTLVKICGTTSRGDALLAQEAGADFIGVVLDHPPSPRHVALADATQVLGEVQLALVALSVNQPLEWHEQARQVLAPLAPRLISQLHGDESPDLIRQLKERDFEVWTAVGEPGEAGLRRAHAMLVAGADAILVDARAVSASGVVYGGTGHRSDWNLAARLVEEGARVVLAGGLNPSNVSEAVQAVRPWAVDCISGVEERRGKKDAVKVRAFVETARE
jgi:phosphoribosylanthranilate isomerase